MGSFVSTIMRFLHQRWCPKCTITEQLYDTQGIPYQEDTPQISQGHFFRIMKFGVIHEMARTVYISTYACMYMEDDFLKGKQEPPYYSALKGLIKNIPNSKFCRQPSFSLEHLLCLPAHQLKARQGKENARLICSPFQ